MKSDKAPVEKITFLRENMLCDLDTCIAKFADALAGYERIGIMATGHYMPDTMSDDEISTWGGLAMMRTWLQADIES